MTSDQGLVHKYPQYFFKGWSEVDIYVCIYLKNGKEQLGEQIKNLKQDFNQVCHLKRSEIFSLKLIKKKNRELQLFHLKSI